MIKKYIYISRKLPLIWFSSHEEIEIFVRYVMRPFHPSFADTFYINHSEEVWNFVLIV